MAREKLTRKELVTRYRKGERDFADVDLSGANLRGLNLREIDLTNADLSYAILQGTQFLNSVLIKTCFSHSKAGMQRRWISMKTVILFCVSVVFNLVLLIFGAIFLSLAFGQNKIEVNGAIPVITVIMILGIFVAIACQGLTFRAGNTILGLIAVVGTIAAVESASDTGSLGVVLAFAGAIVGVLAVALTVAFAVVLAVVGTRAFAFACASILAAEGISAGAGALAVVGTLAVTRIVTIAFVALSVYIAWRALNGDEKFAVVRVFTLAIGAVGGTRFAGADLTGATFAQATLKNANFANSRTRPTVLTRVRWHGAKQLDRARLGSSILQNAAVREVLVNPESVAGKDFANVNLRGANLAGANLAGANLVGANLVGAILTDAVLQDAQLQTADLSEASCIGTDFTRADLTGATLESWNIDSTTELAEVHSDYVYLQRPQQERRPNSGTFGPGEFTKLFQEVLDTIDLIFRDGVDWKAFLRTFNHIQVQHANAELAVQSIENKGDGVVVVKLNAAPGADKSAIHQDFTEGYQLALAEVEARYKAQLNAKDSEIQIYRQPGLFHSKRIFGNTETVYRSCQPPQHDANHGNVDQGFR